MSSKKPDEVRRRRTLGRHQRPFDDTSIAHTIVRAMEDMDYRVTDPSTFIRRIQHVEYGLSAEIEFAALLRWLGACSFVHRMSDDAFSDPTRSKWQVPDLLAVFQNGDLSCSAVIEVKTTSTHTLRLKEDYLARLHAYADLVGQPLLLAWRPRKIGFWTLVDPCHVTRVNEETFELGLENAIMNDLMSTIAGDFYIVPEKGAGLIIETSRISEKRQTTDGYEAMFRIDNAYIRNGDGNPICNVPNAIIWILFSAMEERCDANDNGFVQEFVASGGMTRAQLILRTAAGFRLNEEQRIHWKVIGTNLDTIVNSRDLLCQSQTYLGTFVRYIFHVQPKNIPRFLPKQWEFRNVAPITD